jgi:hypothetical protein
MVNEKKPSIYSDRGAIGSADELDEYGVWVKSEPQDLSSVSTEARESTGFALPDFDTEFEDLTSGDSGSTGFEEEAIPDLDIPADDFTAEGGIESVDESPAEESAGFDDLEISGDSAEDSSAAVENFTEVSIGEFMDTGESAFAPPQAAAAEPPRREAPAQNDLSTQLLMKIADELSSIRTELSTLKKEFAGLRSETAEEAKSEDKHGFFVEEDDEKIALTGDELDNILNTADFTEEAGATEELDSAFSFADVPEPAPESEPLAANEALPDEPAADEGDESEAESEEEEFIDIDLNDLGLDLDPEKLLQENEAPEETGPEPDVEITDITIEDSPVEAAAEEQVFETASLDLSPSDENLLNESELAIEGLESEISGIALDTEMSEIDLMDDSEELKALREEGVLPMTAAPEDTSYLEEDSLALEGSEATAEISFEDDSSFDSTSIDLSEAVIDEPDLSAEIVENPVQEPVLDDISIDGGMDDIDDISIDIDTEIEGMEDLAAGSGEEAELPVPEDVIDTHIDSETGDDSFAQVIPEGFEVGAADAPVSFDDELDENAFAEEGLDNISADEPSEAAGETADAEAVEAAGKLDIPSGLKSELKTVLSYMDQLLESLPEDKIEEFAKSEYFDTYKKLFKELGLV